MNSITPGLVIGIPTLGRPLPLNWALAFKALNPPINYNVVHATIHGKPVADARNDIAKIAIEQNAKYLFFLGDDVVVPAHTLRQLIFRMEQDPELGVVGGVYCAKCEPPAPLVFRGNGHGSYWDWKVGEYFRVTGLGMDCTLIRVDVFKQLKENWFKTVDEDEFLEGKIAANQWTEDLWFLDRVLKETKYEIFCDASVICEHWDVYKNKAYTLPAYSLPLRRAKVEETEKRIVDLGCGPLYREFSEGKPIRVDINEDWNPDYRCDVRNLPFATGEFDIVFSSHVLEHFSRAEWPKVLMEWIRILNPEGELRLVLPNIAWAAERVLQDIVDTDVLNVFYGAQSSRFDFHYNGFTPTRIQTHLATLGFTKIEVKTEGYNIIVNARR